MSFSPSNPWDPDSSATPASDVLSTDVLSTDALITDVVSTDALSTESETRDQSVVARPITLWEFARICDAIYDRNATALDDFRRFNDTRGPFGFDGAIYLRPNGVGVDYVVAIAGTDKTSGFDIATDLGFGEDTPFIDIPVRIYPLYFIFIRHLGKELLSAYCDSAYKLVNAARSLATPEDRVYLTGHSLGGGIVQIISAQTSVPAVAISAAPVVTLPGVLETWERNGRPPIACLRVQNDPINLIAEIGNKLSPGGPSNGWLGRVILMSTSRTGMDAHLVGLTAAELAPEGRSAELGASDPFSL